MYTTVVSNFTWAYCANGGLPLQKNGHFRTPWTHFDEHEALAVIRGPSTFSVVSGVHDLPSPLGADFIRPGSLQLCLEVAANNYSAGSTIAPTSAFAIALAPHAYPCMLGRLFT
jgi:hypothetical protein